MFGHKKKKAAPGDISSTSDRTLAEQNDFHPTEAQIKRATRTRLCWALFTSFLLIISVVFLILVEIGNTSIDHALNRIYFIRLDLTNIVPLSIPNAVLINSVAQTLGLHDFYTVGLWNFCEGNAGVVTNCAHPHTLYWFNPVAILQSELLAGATIQLPAEVTNILNLIRIVSHFMFGLFLTGLCTEFVLIFLIPLSVYSRWASFAIGIFTFLAALCTTVAAVIATVLFIIAKNAVTSVTQLNIGASLGTEMFVFFWIASATAILAWLINMGLCCCCASRRDVRTGRKKGNKKAYGEENGVVAEKPATEKKRRGLFGRRGKAEAAA